MPPERPLVRVVVVNYRAADLTLRCVDALTAQTYPAERTEVVVVDNASGDGLEARIAERHPRVRFVACDRNGGFGSGCNAGMAAPGDWDCVALVNNDSVPEPGWLDALVVTLTDPPPTTGRVGAVAGKVLLGGTEPPRVNSAGCDLLPGGFNADRGDGEPDGPPYDDAREVFGWSGASALLTRDLLDDVGRFDEGFFLYYEDTDMVWRSRRRGWSVVYGPAAVSHHDRGASAGRGDLFWYHDTRNRLMVVARHAPLAWLARALAVQVRLLVRGDPAGASRRVRARALAGLARRLVGLVRDRRRVDRSASVGRGVVAGWVRA